jgi:hypothetical protein
MSRNVIANRYYPQLSDLITVDDLPDFLDFAKEGLADLLSSIFYKNLQYTRSQRGDAAFYKIDIISNNIGLDLPFGMRLILNPDDGGDTSISSFPVSLQYQWPILSLIRSFSLPSFSFGEDGMFQLGLQLFKVTDQEAIANALNIFVQPANTSTTKYQQLIDDINRFYPAADISLLPGQTPTVPLITLLITENPNIPKSVSELVFDIYILNSDISTTKRNLTSFYRAVAPSGVENYINALISPQVKATLALSLGIEFPTNVLQPVDVNGNIIPGVKSIFKFVSASFYVDTQSGIGSQIELAGSLIPTYAEIANTGLIISFQDAKLDLSTTTNIPEADAAGYPVSFVGLYVRQASVSFSKFGDNDPDHESVSLTVKNFLIGTGGVSGTVTFADTGLLYRKFGNFAVELDTFSITFRQNAIISSSISGKLILPSGFNDSGNPAIILIDVSIKDSGDFSITAKPLDVLPTFTLPNVFTLTVRSLTIGEKAGRFFIAVAGTLDFIADIPVLGEVLPKGIIINKLIIWDNGDLEFEGGGLVVPKAFKLQVGPVKLEVTHLSLGSYTKKLNGTDRNYYYFGFDGMVNTGAAGIDAQGNGIKYYFTHDNGPFDNYLSIDGIAIDITIPGDASASNAAFVLDGYLSMKNPDPNIVGSNAGTEYTGKVSFAIPRLHLAGSAAMRLNPDIPAFVVDIGLELPTAIPLGGTGLGIYAFRGLIGQHYVPSKSATTPPLPDTASWWDYYKAKSTVTGQEGIEVDKFASKSGFSIGAGVSLATNVADSGFIFSAKLFLLLGLPDVFLIQGQAAILRSRIGLQDDVDPPFSALIVFGDQSVQGNLSVNFNLPDSGAAKGFITSLQAELAMAFFFNNVSGWYLNIGKDTPASAQVQAKILTLFQGHAYVMISSQGIKAGAGVSFDFNKSFGPVGVALGAYLNLGGFISFKPVQIGGFIQVGGYAYIKLFAFKVGLSVAIGLAVEAPNPFNIVGSLQVKIKTPFFLPDINFSLEISWRFNDNQQVLLVPVAVLSLPDPATGYFPVAAKNILTNEIFPVNYVNADNVTIIPPPGDPAWVYNFTDQQDVENVIIPLDSFIDIELLKAVKPGSVPIGGASNQLPDGYMELIPPQKGINAQVKHQYEITAVGVYAWSNNGPGSTWVPYNIYEAVTAIVDANTGPDAVDLSQLKQGYWQFTSKNQYNKIRLLSQNMFSFMNGTTSTQSDLDALNFSSGDVFCYENIQKDHVINWKAVPVDTTYPENSPVAVQLLTFTFSGAAASVVEEASFGDLSLLMDGSRGNALIAFPSPVGYIKLEFGDNQNNVTVNFIQTAYTPGDFGQAVASYRTISTFLLIPGQQNAVVTYNNIEVLIDQVQLTFNNISVPDYEGDLVIGGHYQLPAQYISPGLNGNIEMNKSLLFSTWYQQSFTAAEILEMDYRGQDGTVAQWPLDSVQASVGGLNGILSGSPDLTPGFYEADTNNGVQQLHQIYSYTSNADALTIPYNPVIKIENASFAFEFTAVFDPFSAGMSTLLYKIKEDEITGYKKGYALHLLQNTPASRTSTYTNIDSIPVFTILLTCYDGTANSGIKITEPYSLDCTTSKIVENQYKRIFVSVNRNTGKIELYIDKILKYSDNIPAELNVFEIADAYTYLNQLTYVTQSEQERQIDNQVTKAGMINEVQVMSDSLNKTIQPLWRPDTTYAIKITTQDRVNGSIPAGSAHTHIFGFKTAGPLGHFHQESKIYQQLAAQDQADAFKLADLRFYIDYDRSFPDAQGRYNLSKPVLYHNPQVKLFFTKPYMNAMYANWDSYQGMPAIQSSLELALQDPSGAAVTRQLVWNPVQETAIDSTNYGTLPHDQQILYLFNQAASQGGCNPMPSPVTKRLQQGSYQFPDLEPNKLYTALFNAIYQPDGSDPDSAEVYKFSFMTSRYATFQDQAGSFILTDTAGAEQYAIYTTAVSFSQAYIDGTLKVLINDDLTDDPLAILQYATKYNRLVYGGLQLASPEAFDYSVIQLVINTDPADRTRRKILGILVYNPEPFNDPKLPAESVKNTIALTLVLPNSTVIDPAQFIYIYSGDNSAVFITNTDMDIPLSSLQLYFRYKIFNGTDYETEYQDYNGPTIDITPYF